MSAWALLRKTRGDDWQIVGGAEEREDLFFEVSQESLIAYLDPRKYRIVFCANEVRVGATVSLSLDGQTVVYSR